MIDADTPETMSARLAVQRLVGVRADFRANCSAIRAISDAAAAGLISASAEKAIKLDRTRMPSISANSSLELENYPLPAELWRGATAPDPNGVVSWLSGNTRLYNSGHVWLIAGLRFKTADIEKLAGDGGGDLAERSDDEILAALMHRRIKAGQYPSMTAASNALASIAAGTNTTQESRAKRLQRTYARLYDPQ